MGSRLVGRTEFATIRVVTSEHGDVSDDVVERVFKAIMRGEKVALSRKLDPGQVFVTIVAGEFIDVGEGEYGVAMYQQGIDSIVMAGMYPEGTDMSRDAWLDEVSISAAHEYSHHIQHLEGRLGGPGDAAAEDEAERMAAEMAAGE